MFDYRCKNCGAYLDPAEHCECEEQRKRKIRALQEILNESDDGQITLDFSRMKKRKSRKYLEEELLNV